MVMFCIYISEFETIYTKSFCSSMTAGWTGAACTSGTAIGRSGNCFTPALRVEYGYCAWGVIAIAFRAFNWGIRIFHWAESIEACVAIYANILIDRHWNFLRISVSYVLPWFYDDASGWSSLARMKIFQSFFFNYQAKVMDEFSGKLSSRIIFQGEFSTIFTHLLANFWSIFQFKDSFH